MSSLFPPAEILQAWNITQHILPAPDAGLINHTYLVGEPPEAVLQWVNPIFDPKIHIDLTAITAHLHQKGLVTPSLLPTGSGDSFVETDNGSWRLWTFIQGRTLHQIHSATIANEAGAMLARFHRALEDYAVPRTGAVRDIHNTQLRMDNLVQALSQGQSHPLWSEVEPLGETILSAWESLDVFPDLPLRTCHGDPKISNLHFHPTEERAICMLDLDTVGPQRIDAELGDAWRSWCNPAGESDPKASRFDFELFRQSLHGYVQEAPQLAPDEKESLVPGIMRISLELSARFCADALQNTYFAENRTLYPVKGRHNLTRALSQFTLYQSIFQQQSALESLIQQQEF